MKFGLYLVKKGVITPAQLVHALEKQQAHQRPLGQLAMEEGILSAREVFKILRCQSGMPHERFGEVAVGMRMMTNAELERLLMRQWELQPPLEEILVRQRILTQVQLDEQLTAYRHEMAQKNVVIKRSIVAPRIPEMPTRPLLSESETHALMM
jgi:hypothetical protein